LTGRVSRLWERSRPRRTALAKRLGDLGTQRGISWLEYNPLVFLYLHEKASADAPVVIASFERVFPNATSYYDVGAGTATYAAQAKRRGKQVLACEHSRIGRVAAWAQQVPCTAFDLAEEPPVKTRHIVFDLAYCFEVAEHVPAHFADRLVSHLVNSAKTVVFTAAPPGQGGTGHVNEQPRDYWIERFARHGTAYREDLTHELSDSWRAGSVASWWLPDNVMVFDRPRPTRAG
jgi:SAM-dependent methyltransferase